jgi:hypothetical protein
MTTGGRFLAEMSGDAVPRCCDRPRPTAFRR